MTPLGDDRVARWVLAAAFGSAALLVVISLWSGSVAAPLHWARARWSLPLFALCIAASGASAWLAWRRRTVPTLWVPLVGGALTCIAAMLSSVIGAA